MPESRMQVVVHPSARAAARAVAQFLARNLRDTPDLVLGLPTGQTMIPVYYELADLYRRGRLPLKDVTAFNLDEFEGLAPGDSGSFAAYMRTHFYDRVGMRRGACRFPPVNGREPEAYDRGIAKAGGLDLCLLGLGANGHIGFNEPGDALAPHTHRVRLQPATRRANAYLFEGRVSRVPTHAVSMGMATILQARAVMLIATGAGKAAIVRRALRGPITTRVPASLIQLHPHAIVFLDNDAAAQLATNN